MDAKETIRLLRLMKRVYSVGPIVDETITTAINTIEKVETLEAENARLEKYNDTLIADNNLLRNELDTQNLLSHENVKIIEHEYIDGEKYNATIQIKDNYYWIDLVKLSDYGNECMAFASNKKGQVINWMELYCNRDVSLTKESFEKCIKEFSEKLRGVEDGR